MEYKYTGKLEAVVYRGVSFVKGEYTPVSDSIAERLEGNVNFKRKTVAKKKAADDDA